MEEFVRSTCGQSKNMIQYALVSSVIGSGIRYEEYIYGRKRNRTDGVARNGASA